MIRYALVCDTGHAFETWFSSSEAFDQQAEAQLVTCPQCGSVKVEKALMTPRLGRGQADSPVLPMPAAEPASAVKPEPKPESPPAARDASQQVALMSPAEREFRAKLKELRDHLTRNSDNVGTRFPTEARRMHYGEIEHRSIYGQASAEDVKALHEEGVEFHPLPVLPDERN